MVVAQPLDHACLAGGLERIGQAVAEHDLNRVVVAGCAARLYEPAFARMMGEAGLNPGLLERVNLRGECAWVHSGNGTGAIAKAKELTAMGVASARLRKPVFPAVAEVARRALVIGGGLAGMTAAVSLSEMGYGVDLVEQSAELGGQLRELRYTLAQGDAPAAFLASLIERVEGDEGISVHRETRVTGVSGIAGQFQTTLALSDGEETLQHGAVIVASGGHEATTTEYSYGQNPQVLTQRELESRMSTAVAGRNSEFAIPNSVIMIQCVGSRE
ncbi:MAG: CoB--CoM heterodisulfide reductase iron-sulfur subunit A family protein, partial [bacterium]|nr:CoB--CoM heterodisulfide reductase iron-sulfur subunit A family protein [bacterium]